MLPSRQINLLLVFLASCTASGCVAFHTTRPVELVLAHAESGQPVANQQVSLSYKRHMFQGAPGSITDHTDDRGRVVLHIAEVEFNLALQVGRATFSIDREIVRTGGALNYSDDQENLSLRVIPRTPTLIERLFGFGIHGTCGVL